MASCCWFEPPRRRVITRFLSIKMARLMRIAYKAGVIGIVTLAFFLLRQFIHVQLIKVVNYRVWESHLSFDSERGLFRIMKDDLKTINQTILKVIVEDESISRWEDVVGLNHLDVSFLQSSLVVTQYTTTSSNPVCYNVTAKWNEGLQNEALTHCLQFGDDFWYGGAETYEQRWPINVNADIKATSQKMKFYPFQTHRFGNFPDAPGSVLERYWLSSKGVAIFVDHDVPLHITQNETHLCLRSAPTEHWTPEILLLKYTVCIGNDIKAIHKFMSKTYWPNPTDIPDETMIKYPIWTTWIQYKRNITQDAVIDFARQIKNHNFPVSQIEIDDMYSTSYGDFNFDGKKFPDPKLMIEILHSLGYRVTAWIHPFIDLDSDNYALAKRLGYLVLKDKNTKQPLITKWWNADYSSLLDFTNEDAVKWYFNQRQVLVNLGVDSFKYDGGETNFLTNNFATNITINDPNLYSTAYANAAYSHTNKYIEVRVGYMTQHLPIFVRIMTMRSLWAGNRGLNVLIPSVLHFGLIGYPFVLPDIIGGTKRPSRELFIRWTQINAFLPSMQFSILPWTYDQEVVDLCRKLVDLHVNYVTPLIIKWGKVSVATGDPIIRPLWWVAPNDKRTYNDSRTFLIGEDVLVAPIVSKGQTQRDIYLPRGTWKDMMLNKIIWGPITLRDYSIPLKNIAYFEKVNL